MAYTKIMGIYAIRLKGKCYFGSAVCIKGRINMHKRELRNGIHSNSYLQRIYNKYADQLEYVVVEECERDELRTREQYYIDTYEGELLNLSKIVCELAPAEEHSKRMKGAWAKRGDQEREVISNKISNTLKEKYQNDPAALERARSSLEIGRSCEAMMQNKTSPEANEKRRQSSLKQWEERDNQDRENVGSKISVGMMDKMTKKERQAKASTGGSALWARLNANPEEKAAFLEKRRQSKLKNKKTLL